jgi:hypothetical protein
MPRSGSCRVLLSKTTLHDPNTYVASELFSMSQHDPRDSGPLRTRPWTRQTPVRPARPARPALFCAERCVLPIHFNSWVLNKRASPWLQPVQLITRLPPQPQGG